MCKWKTAVLDYGKWAGLGSGGGDGIGVVCGYEGVSVFGCRLGVLGASGSCGIVCHGEEEDERRR